MDAKNQPIIIKKVVKGHGGHHGGSWKVAFADFAVAMMAFFMLMWILGGPTSEEQKAGISDYFRNPSIFIGKSSVAGPAPNVFGPPTEKGLTMMKELTKGEKIQIEISEGGQKVDVGKDPDARIAMDIEQQRLEELLAELKAAVNASQALKPFKDQLKLDITPEGLRIQILDKEGRPMFDSGGDTLKDHMVGILHAVAKTLIGVPNKISISGHTDATPFFGREGYSNWELSADRANAARRELMRAGIQKDKVSRVVGLADSVLFDKANPESAINRRISIIVMNRDLDEAIEENREQIEEAREKGLTIDSTTGDEATDKAITEGIIGGTDEKAGGGQAGEVSPAEVAPAPLTISPPVVTPTMPQVGPAIDPNAPAPVRPAPKSVPEETDKQDTDTAPEQTDEVAPAEVAPPPAPLTMPSPVVIPSMPQIGPATDLTTPAAPTAPLPARPAAKPAAKSAPGKTVEPKTDKGTDKAARTKARTTEDNKAEEAPRAAAEKKQPRSVAAPKSPVKKQQPKPTSIGPKTPMIDPIQLPFPGPSK
ncbi:MAG: hypothetical protein BMS9Abin26_2101 [Gammaproteobacteria bacterium]|nr:MAG: hypothetical protein BMS9Abin26_2101 [Gammaproteobacteria bacterium]